MPVGLLLVNTTLPPAQNVVGPDAEIVGVAGIGFTVTTVGADAGEVHPDTVCVTVYEPLVVTVMACVVAPPGDQVLPKATLEVKTTFPPAQKVVGPPAVTLGAAGIGFTVTTVGADVAVQPFTSVIWTE